MSKARRSTAAAGKVVWQFRCGRLEHQSPGGNRVIDRAELAAREGFWPRAGQVLLGVGLVVAGYLAAGHTGGWLLYPYYLASLAAIAWVDLRERRIPNRIVCPAILVALGAAIGRPGWQTSLAGGVAMAALLWLPAWIAKLRPGSGDVKLGLLIGLVLGLSWALYGAVVVAFGGALLAGLVGILLKRWDRRSMLPFGPFLALGMIAGLLIQAL